MLTISKKAQSSSLSPIRKFYPYQKKAEERGVKIYSLNIGQPDIQTPPLYFEAIKEATLKVDSYAPSLGRIELLDAIRNYYNRLGISISNNNIVVTTGGSEAILMSAFCILDEGDEVIVPSPFYPNYNTLVNAVGGKIVALKTYAEDDYFYADRNRLEEVYTDKTKAIIITNPNNPTGTILNDKDMRVIIDFALSHNLYIICDEVYREICFTHDKITSILKYEDAINNVIVIDSVSKRFSCCGARIGAMISKNQQIVENTTKLAQARLSVSTLNQIGAAAMYNGTDASYFNGVKEKYQSRVQVVVDELMKIKGVKVSKPKGAFYIMATLPLDDAEDFQRFLLEEFCDNNETVMFAPASNFYKEEGKGKNEIRLAAVLNEKDLKRGIELLAKGLSVYKSTH